jgi:Holliday junction DNA helicase RuvA
MIAFVEGVVDSVGGDSVVVNVHGVGYLVFMPSRALIRRKPGESIRIYTHQHVREDAILLYGFETEDEKELFVRLQNVSGIGPKVALSLMGAADRKTICKAILEEDVAMLASVPGIGKKTAQRIVIDLKDKLDDLTVTLPVVERGGIRLETGGVSGSGAIGDIIEALLGLGYNEKEIRGVVQLLKSDIEQGAPLEEIIKMALQRLTRV